MRYMMMIKACEGVPPSPELFAAIDKFSREMSAAGVLLETGGLAPSANGARVRLSGGRVTVTDGPFAETKEVIGGFAIIEAPSRADAIDNARRFMQLHADVMGKAYEAECEVREMWGAPAGVGPQS